MQNNEKLTFLINGQLSRLVSFLKNSKANKRVKSRFKILMFKQSKHRQTVWKLRSLMLLCVLISSNNGCALCFPGCYSRTLRWGEVRSQLQSCHVSRLFEPWVSLARLFLLLHCIWTWQPPHTLKWNFLFQKALRSHIF